jgi:ketosteroid isomerase-like protein
MGVGKDLWTEMVTRYNKQDWSGVASMYASDAVLVDPNGRCEGRDAISAYFGALRGRFPIRSIETSVVIEEGDTAVAEWTWRGTNTGPLTLPDGSEMAATGKVVELPGVSVVTVRDGKLATQHDYADTAAIASKLGLLPST